MKPTLQGHPQEQSPVRCNHQLQPAAPAATQSNGYVAFTTPEPKGSVPVAQATSVQRGQMQQQHRGSPETIGTCRGSPQDWETKLDPVSGKPFYFNLKTNERSFVIPSVLAPQPEMQDQAHRQSLVSARGGSEAQADVVAAEPEPQPEPEPEPEPQPQPQPQPQPVTESAPRKSAPPRAFFESLAKDPPSRTARQVAASSKPAVVSPSLPLTLEAADSSEGGTSAPSTPGTAGSSAAFLHSDPFGEEDASANSYGLPDTSPSTESEAVRSASTTRTAKPPVEIEGNMDVDDGSVHMWS